mmetsp:Transcript_8114/g.14669  ORF Transcript_8114/g.14669 Transcript_8114/m.14669 type:complete len:332 (+) Transcript_8114:74-1069(+)|eukprot:CAMPEP_0201632320 /NCGR_PEP_ID=MMETSP0493-20130528/5999_1 /ASSEMBLY_ACC=CAM_ASM_000838 /TAXON_ID=420259 /ORGANISM="Thalassiosira gravida, Strain GMp14c1" /LENGTH=331 /DNA_ID=CAMNT_0048103827 /DNA_START=19 /DNA_END=1014 /DNA_ORIENTATION=+
MMCRCRCFRPIIVIYAAFLCAYIPQYSTSEPQLEFENTPRRLDIGLGNHDEYAQTVLTVQAPPFPRTALGINEDDHEMVTSILKSTREMVDVARVLIMNEGTMEAGQEMMAQANSMFREVKDHLMMRQYAKKQQEGASKEVLRDLLREKYSAHDVVKAQEDEKRGLDVARKMYETMISFPECLEKFFDACLKLINEELDDIGLSSVEVVVHEKRNADQEGYNKVVIVTNELADRVSGKSGDGIVEYPFMWNDANVGFINLGVDGKWNCSNKTPADCCVHVRESAPNPDINDKYLECHIFVPYGGIGNERRNDRIFINVSPDGRVHEAPQII